MFPYTARASQDICSSWISHYPTEKTWSHVPWNHGGMVATYGFIWSIDVRGPNTCRPRVYSHLDPSFGSILDHPTMIILKPDTLAHPDGT